MRFSGEKISIPLSINGTGVTLAASRVLSFKNETQLSLRSLQYEVSVYMLCYDYVRTRFKMSSVCRKMESTRCRGINSPRILILLNFFKNLSNEVLTFHHLCISTTNILNDFREFSGDFQSNSNHSSGIFIADLCVASSHVTIG
jgi:hypothetical protein